MIAAEPEGLKSGEMGHRVGMGERHVREAQFHDAAVLDGDGGLVAVENAEASCHSRADRGQLRGFETGAFEQRVERLAVFSRRFGQLSLDGERLASGEPGDGCSDGEWWLIHDQSPLTATAQNFVRGW